MSQTNTTAAFLTRHRYVATICVIAFTAVFLLASRAGATPGKSTTFGTLVVKIETAGGPYGRPNTHIAGHAVFIARSGATHELAITVAGRTVTLPTGSYRAYATSPQYDSGTVRCDAAGPVIVARTRRQVVFYCEEK